MTATIPREKIKKRRVTFALRAPNAEEVILLGDFNRWNEKKHRMKKDENGIWKKVVIIPAGRYEYKYLVDGRWQIDPKNRDVCPNCFGSLNNIIVVET